MPVVPIDISSLCLITHIVEGLFEGFVFWISKMSEFLHVCVRVYKSVDVCVTVGMLQGKEGRLGQGCEQVHVRRGRWGVGALGVQ